MLYRTKQVLLVFDDPGKPSESAFPIACFTYFEIRTNVMHTSYFLSRLRTFF